MIPELVTIFLPTYSRMNGGYLQRAIESILNQNYGHFECFVIDDASVDGSRELIEYYGKLDARIKPIRLKRHLGLPALSTGLAFPKAKGKYVTFAYDDAVLYPHHLSMLVLKLQEDPDLGMAYGKAKVADPGYSGLLEIGAPYDYERMLRVENHVPNLSVMVKRDIFEEIGWFDPHVILKRCCDWDCWVRISQYYRIGFVDMVLAEEYGPSLPDSMSNSTSYDLEIIAKYARLQRNHLLKPHLLPQYQPFRLDFPYYFTDDEYRFIQALIQEHHANNKN